MSGYITYILQSQSTLRCYIGLCGDMRERLTQHNGGAVRSTKYGIPWKMVYVEEYNTRQEAYRRELENLKPRNIKEVMPSKNY